VEDHLGKTGEHHLCDYFDMIAGTSSGGLITAMITTRTSERSRVPIFKATQVVEFFKQDAVKIFPETFK
jgi:patatin-like phospholipase/acyl hydrolase